MAHATGKGRRIDGYRLMPPTPNIMLVVLFVSVCMSNSCGRLVGRPGWPAWVAWETRVDSRGRQGTARDILKNPRVTLASHTSRSIKIKTSKGVVHEIQKTSQNKGWSVFGKGYTNFSKFRTESVREW